MDVSSVTAQNNSQLPGQHEVEVFCKDIQQPAWIKNIEPFVLKVLNHQNYRNWSLSIVFCNDSYIQILNSKYRHKDNATDVLSFAQIDSPAELSDGIFYAGDIVISLDSLAGNARYFEVDEEEELKRLLIHGILHLGGWNHSDTDQRMLKKQEELVSVLSEENIY